MMTTTTTMMMTATRLLAAKGARRPARKTGPRLRPEAREACRHRRAAGARPWPRAARGTLRRNHRNPHPHHCRRHHLRLGGRRLLLRLRQPCFHVDSVGHRRCCVCAGACPVPRAWTATTQRQRRYCAARAGSSGAAHSGRHFGDRTADTRQAAPCSCKQRSHLGRNAQWHAAQRRPCCCDLLQEPRGAARRHRHPPAVCGRRRARAWGLEILLPRHGAC
jgi:hypothetical protein